MRAVVGSVTERLLGERCRGMFSDVCEGRYALT